jgi:putative membrane protein
MYRIHVSLLAAGLVAALSGSAFAQTPKTDPKTEPKTTAATSMKTATADTEFAQKAAMGGKKEVATAKMAAGKSKNADVKALANKLVTDHTKANQELMNLMKTKHIAAGAEPKAEPEPWRSKTGAEFDRGFVDHVIEHHEKDIAMFETEANSGSDAELKNWASQKLPTLREHLKMAQDAKSKLSTTTDR